MNLPEGLTDNQKSSQAGYFQRSYGLFDRFCVFDFLVLFICAASFGGSLIESIVNNDNMHWGWAYIEALDLKRGAIPHAEVLIFYGYIQTLIHSLALSLFGERLISVGIITGLFYSLTLFLSYCVFLRVLKKNLAFIAVLFIFLIHPYIIYPFPNYIAYTFQLLALIFFLRYQENHYNGLGAGFFLCLSVLSRYSSVIAILPPFILLLCWDFFTVQGAKKNIIKKIMAVSCGFVIPLILFFTYLFINSALDDFFYQNKMLINIMGKVSDIDTFLNFLASILQIVPSYASDLRGKLFTLILIICFFVFIREIIRIKSDKSGLYAYDSYDLLAICLVTAFGYLNSVHVYETFRLVNGASLGVGLSVFVFYDFFYKALRPLKYIMIICSILLFLYLSSTLLFNVTSSSYYPWRTDLLLHNGVRNNTIGIFKGKIMSKEYNDFYQEAFDAIAPYKNSCYIINYTSDVIAVVMNDLPRIQIAPVHFPWLDDVTRQAALIDAKKAVVLSYKPLEFDGYKKIFKGTWPDEIPWLGGGCLFIYAPQQYAPDNKVLPDKKNN
jgi:hypothetical protein